jgi:hypothetical protein
LPCKLLSFMFKFKSSHLVHCISKASDRLPIQGLTLLLLLLPQIPHLRRDSQWIGQHILSPLSCNSIYQTSHGSPLLCIPPASITTLCHWPGGRFATYVFCLDRSHAVLHVLFTCVCVCCVCALVCVYVCWCLCVRMSVWVSVLLYLYTLAIQTEAAPGKGDNTD